jgi:methylenetetrahydrofolate--tRNA-(uracil-5-)-methyltransferase
MGVEGYIGSTAMGWVAGVNASRVVAGQAPIVPPPETMIGALCHYTTDPQRTDAQPMKANFGIVPPLVPTVRNKRERYRTYATRALGAIDAWKLDSGLVVQSDEMKENLYE